MLLRALVTVMAGLEAPPDADAGLSCPAHARVVALGAGLVTAQPLVVRFVAVSTERWRVVVAHRDGQPVLTRELTARCEELAPLGLAIVQRYLTGLSLPSAVEPERRRSRTPEVEPESAGRLGARRGEVAPSERPGSRLDEADGGRPPTDDARAAGNGGVWSMDARVSGTPRGGDGGSSSAEEVRASGSSGAARGVGDGGSSSTEDSRASGVSGAPRGGGDGGPSSTEEVRASRASGAPRGAADGGSSSTEDARGDGPSGATALLRGVSDGALGESTPLGSADGGRSVTGVGDDAALSLGASPGPGSSVGGSSSRQSARGAATGLGNVSADGRAARPVAFSGGAGVGVWWEASGGAAAALRLDVTATVSTRWRVGLRGLTRWPVVSSLTLPEGALASLTAWSSSVLGAGGLCFGERLAGCVELLLGARVTGVTPAGGLYRQASTALVLPTAGGRVASRLRVARWLEVSLELWVLAPWGRSTALVEGTSQRYATPPVDLVGLVGVDVSP